jgi:hypothetical protein
VWRILLFAVALLLVGETVLAARGWRGRATRATLGALDPNVASARSKG